MHRELSKLQGSAKERSGRQKRARKPKEGLHVMCVCMCESVCVCVYVFVGQEQLSHFSLLGNMKPDKQRNYAASYSEGKLHWEG